MTIVEVTKKEIFCYHDYEFHIFDRDALVDGSEIVGVCWPGGKSRTSPVDVTPGNIRRGTPYHQILIMTLLENLEAQE